MHTVCPRSPVLPLITQQHINIFECGFFRAKSLKILRFDDIHFKNTTLIWSIFI